MYLYVKHVVIATQFRDGVLRGNALNSPSRLNDGRRPKTQSLPREGEARDLVANASAPEGARQTGRTPSRSRHTPGGLASDRVATPVLPGEADPQVLGDQIRRVLGNQSPRVPQIESALVAVRIGSAIKALRNLTV